MRPLLAVPLFAAATIAQDVPAPARFEATRAAIASEADTDQTPSIAVAVLEHGEVVWAEGFGQIDLARRTRATADSIYRLASISKPFTATAILQLVERGLVGLDAPANRCLDAPLRAYRGTADRITIRRLCNHTAGPPTHWNFLYAGEPPPRAESIRAFGLAVARVGKNGYRDWLVEELRDPLGMTHTDVGVRPGMEEHAALPTAGRAMAGPWSAAGAVRDRARVAHCRTGARSPLSPTSPPREVDDEP